jgi:hypothetical protein
MKHEIFKQLKEIAPDPGYSARAKGHILMSVPLPVRGASWRIFAEFFSEHRLRVAVIAIALVLFAGGFSVVQLLNPFKVSPLDPSRLKVEADAIDIQLQIANVGYEAPANGPESTQALPHPARVSKPAAKSDSSVAATSSPDIGIDDALNLLAQ